MTAHGQPDGRVEDSELDRTQPHQLVFPAQRAYDDYEAYQPNHEQEEPSFSEARQRDRFGGLNWGAGFFGALVAASVALTLTAAIGAALALLGLQTARSNLEQSPRPTLIGGAAVVLGVLVAAYYAGGYVAGRMSRFDGGRQGFGAWVMALLMAAVMGGAGLLTGLQLSLFERLEAGALLGLLESPMLWATATGATLLLGSLLAAVAGGKVGCHYHRKVDEAGWL